MSSSLERRLAKLEADRGGDNAGPGIVEMTAAEYRQACETGEVAKLRGLIWVWPDKAAANV